MAETTGNAGMNGANAMQTAPYPKQGSNQTTGAAGAASHETTTDSLRRLRVLEERFINLRKKAQLTEENLLNQEEKLHEELRAMTAEFVEIRHRLAELGEGMHVVQTEMQNAASMYDVKAIEKYLAYWEPLGFVTQAELARRQNLLKEPSGKIAEKTAQGIRNG